MPSVFFKRTALIALALSLALAACVSEHAQNLVGTLNPPCADCMPPDAIMCAAPGAPHGWISVPAGKKPTDLCPENFIGDYLYDLRPGVNYPLPLVAGAATPAQSSTTGQPP